jgi:hypothetical protein
MGGAVGSEGHHRPFLIGARARQAHLGKRTRSILEGSAIVQSAARGLDGSRPVLDAALLPHCVGGTMGRAQKAFESARSRAVRES